MQQIVVNVPDGQYDFFTQLLEKLSFEIVENNPVSLTSDEKEGILDAIAEIEAGESVTFEEFKEELKQWTTK